MLFCFLSTQLCYSILHKMNHPPHLFACSTVASLCGIWRIIRSIWDIWPHAWDRGLNVEPCRQNVSHDGNHSSTGDSGLCCRLKPDRLTRFGPALSADVPTWLELCTSPLHASSSPFCFAGRHFHFILSITSKHWSEMQLQLLCGVSGSIYRVSIVSISDKNRLKRKWLK